MHNLLGCAASLSPSYPILGFPQTVLDAVVAGEDFNVRPLRRALCIDPVVKLKGRALLAKRLEVVVVVADAGTLGDIDLLGENVKGWEFPELWWAR
jgi:hypothetical protein